jgi:hypothetical protein
VHVVEGGTLTFKTTGETAPNGAGPDADLRLFVSDETGKEGGEIAYGAGELPTANEQLAADVEPGWYLARIDWALTAAAYSVEAEMTLTDIRTAAPEPAPAPAPAPAPEPQPEPAPAPAQPQPAPAQPAPAQPAPAKKKAASKKKAKCPKGKKAKKRSKACAKKGSSRKK